MLFMLAWLYWFYNGNKNRIPRGDIDDDNTKSVDPRSASLEKTQTGDEPIHHNEEKRQEIVEEEISISEINVVESNPFDYDIELENFDNITHEYNETVTINTEHGSFRTESTELRSSSVPSSRSAIRVDNNKKNTHQVRSTVSVDIDDKHHTRSQETRHSTFHAELRQPCGTSISLNVVPTTKLKVKSNVSTGRIHSIVLKDHDEKTKVRSVSPAVCVHPESSVHKTHEGYVHPTHDVVDSHLSVKSLESNSSSLEAAQHYHKPSHVNDQTKQEIAEEKITISEINVEENNPLDYDEELEGLYITAQENDRTATNADGNAAENPDPATNDELGSAFVPISRYSITDDNDKSIGDLRSAVTIDSDDKHCERSQGHPIFHAELKQPCGGSISLNVVPTRNLTVKNDATAGRIHSVTLKDDELKVNPRVRSVSPIICIQPESSVHEMHEGHICLIPNAHATDKQESP